MKRTIVMLILGSLLSCTKVLVPPTPKMTEFVNGFEIHWSGSVTAERQGVVKDILEDMICVKGGIFIMGATPEQNNYARNNEYPLSYVQLSDFYICRHEITDEQYVTIVSDSHIGTLSELYLTWNDWDVFISALKEISGLNFDFPTEAQWEYAAKGGVNTKGYIFPGSNDFEEIWDGDKIVGSNWPNELGLYNMADLKSEWCKDCYELYKDTGFIKDRYIYGGKYRVVRGGNYRAYGIANNSTYLNVTTGTVFDSFGHFRGTLSGPSWDTFDYRYCRSTARSYYYVSSGSDDNQIGRSKYIGLRPVINK
ncbi:MAG: formylglycine-generating enzyme family protein [Bacteroidales bacterium]|nr:formylglycine-generating enzyme family protein [Clostridium sp.]MCM1224041.1 formylglycine-generating enzyme family protein [Lachnospiraceae bacterium]MCM1503093.1 formylglycine-generating enzyme family protein [Bacteroidales bacterium]